MSRASQQWQMRHQNFKCFSQAVLIKLLAVVSQRSNTAGNTPVVAEHRLPWQVQKY
jgi:hypothetical protein